ncbi:MAG: YkgJ family cysteine cluster protein, partial [Planctomycetota bacterium]
MARERTTTAPRHAARSAQAGCRRCGACCTGNAVLLSAAEADRFERDPQLARLIVHERTDTLELVLLRRDPVMDRCLALAGPPGAGRCTIYDRRPQLCRAFA